MAGFEALIRNRAYERWEQEGCPKAWHEPHWAQSVYRRVERVRARFTLTMAACNLARLPRLLAL